MSTEAQEILRSAQALPLNEQLEVLQGLAQSLARALSPLAEDSAAFWSHHSLDELERDQQTPIITDVNSLAMTSSPDDETADDLIAFVREQRQADRAH